MNATDGGPVVADRGGAKTVRQPAARGRPPVPKGRFAPSLGPLVLIGLLGCVTSYAQTVDPNLWGADPDGTVLAIARSGNTIYMGGTFTHVAPLTGAGVPFDASTGQPLASFPKVAGYVYCAIPDGLGGWFIGGRLGGVGGVPRRNLAHILRNGQVAGWAPDTDGDVYAFALCWNRPYVGRAFTLMRCLLR